MNQTDYQKLHKWIFQPILISLVTVGAIASQLAAAVITNDAIATPNSTAQLVAQNKAIYRSDRFRFQFSYVVRDFVVQEKSSNNSADFPVWSVDIWTKNHAQKISNGEYEGGTEYPANVNLSVLTGDNMAKQLVS